MKRKIAEIKFMPCGFIDKEQTTRVRVPKVNQFDNEFNNENEIRLETINKAARKIYGKRCFWHINYELGMYYGQVMESLKATKNNSNPGNSSKTNNMRVDIDF